jgi:hypothetical protein
MKRSNFGLFFQKQPGDGLCRIVAINNVLQKTVLTVSSFAKMCDEFDVKHQVAKGTSREFILFEENGENLLCFILKRLSPSLRFHLAFARDVDSEGNQVKIQLS